MKKIPFVYGRVADSKDFTDREQECRHLMQNFSGLVNTIIISPRRWGKTSLVGKATELLAKEDNSIIVCHVDIFNCRSLEQFYATYAAAVLKATHTSWGEFVAGVKKYLGRWAPKVTMSDGAQAYELSFGVDFKDKDYSFDEILDLPQKLSKDKKKRVVMCIDEFQNISDFEDSLGFQQKLRAHWQQHNKVCYCLYGSKRHMLMHIFTGYSMPFYKFGDILFLQKIARQDWIKFIVERFRSAGKQISPELSGAIADLVQCHSYYVQQLSQQVWLRTEKVCTRQVVNDAMTALVAQLSLLFSNIVDSLTPRQVNFLLAIANGESAFSSRVVLQKYNLGASANIKNLRQSTLDKDLIDILPNKQLVLQDPIFEYWLRNEYANRK
ncbi:MAG: ATPase [Prevotellaceae bacterium]|jgi:hypothetical protein|nr:ATPase [Prevotellaceae bacterium]